MNNWFSPVQWLVFLSLWRMSYETANVNRTTLTEKSYLVERSSTEETITPREQEWADKAVNRYAASQEKKWQRWNEAMFERSN
jgi:hypothetical protein